MSADEQRAALDAVDSEIADRLTTEREGSTYDNTLHRIVDNAMYDRYGHLLDRHGSTSPSSIARSRRRLNRPLDRIQRQTDRMHRLASRSDPPESSPHIPQLSPLHPSRTRQASDEQDSDLEPSQSRERKPARKRRKLDDGTAEQLRAFPDYGVEGTLLPGSLNMIMLDLDGSSDAQSTADQIAKVKLSLPSNKDPYRTKRNNCDILMKHSGGHPFALSKLVVKLPKRDYDAPLQGMVFVSMDRETLLSQSSHFNTYFPVSHSHHRRRYDSYRPSVEYMRSTRSPRPTPRTRRPSDSYPQETPWYDSRLSLSEPAEIPSLPGINVTLEPVMDPEESPTYGSRSPRPWEMDTEYSRRTYLDRYRPSSNRTRDRAYVTAAELAARLSPTTSEDEEEDQDQDQDQLDPDDAEEPPLYRGVPPSQRDLEDAEIRQRNVLEQMRIRRDRGDIYAYIPPEFRREQGEDSHTAEQMAAIESTLARRGFDVDALRRRVRDRTNGEHGQSPRPISPHFHSTKRLPGCTGMLQGQSPHSPSDNDPVVPHATFSVGRETGGAVAVNFQPEV